MSTALIGTGFIGKTLLRQTSFDRTLRAGCAKPYGAKFDLVVCAAMPGSKRQANEFPGGDLAALSLIQEMLDVTAKGMVEGSRFVLISTVDIFEAPRGVQENAGMWASASHPYGKNRLALELFVRQQFKNVLIVRLPACVGPGLKKNVVYDLHNDVHLDQIDCRSTYQFYPTVNLWPDILEALKRELRLLHLVAEPITVEEIAREGFGRSFGRQLVDKEPVRYDVWSEHALLTGRLGNYQYSKRESIQAIRAYAQSEPRRAHGID